MQIQELCQDLIGILTANHVGVSKHMYLPVVYATADAKSVDEVIGENFLSHTLMKKVDGEIVRLKSLLQKKIRNKYSKRKNKVKELMSCGHITAADIGFNPDDIGNLTPSTCIQYKQLFCSLFMLTYLLCTFFSVTAFPASSREMKKVILRLKKEILERKELLITLEHSSVRSRQYVASSHNRRQVV